MSAERPRRSVLLLLLLLLLLPPLSLLDVRVNLSAGKAKPRPGLSQECDDNYFNGKAFITLKCTQTSLN